PILHEAPTAQHPLVLPLLPNTEPPGRHPAKQLERELGVTYKTAWRMFNVIRTSLMGDEGIKLSGEVEMDETYVGGKARGREIAAMARTGLGPMQAGQAAARAKKTAVFGMVERGGKVV